MFESWLLPLFFSLLTLAVGVVLKQWFYPTKIHPKAPPIVRGLPLIGSAIEFGTNPREALLQAYRKYGPVFTIQLGTLRYTYLGPVKDFLKVYFQQSSEVLNFYEGLKRMNFDKLFGEVTFSNPVHLTLFTGRVIPKLDTFFPILKAEGFRNFSQLLSSMGRHDPSSGTILLDKFQQLCYPLIARTSGAIFAGTAEGITENEELIRTWINLDEDAAKELGAMMLLPNFLYKLVGGTTEKHFDVMRKYFLPIVKKRRATGERHYDMLQMFIDVKDANGNPLDDDTVITRVGLLVWASVTTTAVALGNTFYDIFCRPHIAKQVQEEVEQVLGDRSAEDLEYQDLKKLTYTEGCIKESLRLATSSLGSVRRAMTDIVVQCTGRDAAGNEVPVDYFIPKGELLLGGQLLNHLDPGNFPEPLEYKPERYLESTKGALKVANYTWLPFGAGANMCPGRFLALLEIKMFMAHIVKNYEIKVLANERPGYDQRPGGSTRSMDVPVVFTPKCAKPAA